MANNVSEIESGVLKWICSELTRLLGTEATEEMARYLLSIENASDLNEYMSDLLDSTNLECKKFISALLQRWQDIHDDGAKGDIAGLPAKLSNPSQLSPLLDLTKQQKKGKKKSISNSSYESTPESNKSSASPGSGSKKTNYVPLFSSEGHKKTIAMLPGRHRCECQALKHDLINNCLSCGRIVCEQEGAGPCLFCSNLVCTKEQQEILAHSSKKSEKLLNHLMKQVINSSDDAVAKGYEKALQHKNKLLEYDRTSVKRTQVIDDESDYFSIDSNQWLKDDEKAKLRKREEELRGVRHASRKDRKIMYTLDFAGRQVVEQETNIDMYNPDDSVIQATNFGAYDSTSTGHGETSDDFNESIVNPNINLPPPKFISETLGNKDTGVVKSSRLDGRSNRKLQRVQDGDLEQMSDCGMALSMHQPWASLLVSGIKKHEGRTWYTAHRGILWIASTSKTPSQEEISQVEGQYRHSYSDSAPQFPKAYPVSCLLGCVEVTDCLAQEDYVEKYPDGESGSPFVFVCENPRELHVKFPMKGKHKIYKLDGNLHKAAKKGIMLQRKDL